MAHRLSLMTLLLTVILVAFLAPHSVGITTEGVLAPSLELQRIQELRRHDVVEPDENEFSMEQPGLSLTFKISLPADRRLLEITNPEPSDVTAADASGRDLSAIEKSFMDRLEYVKVIQTYGEDPSEFTFHLATPARSAATFDLHTELEAVTFTSTEEISLEVGEEWTELDASMFGKKKVQARIQRKGKELSLEVQPGTIKGAIEDVQLFTGNTELEQGWSMWNEMQISYSFSGESTGPITARLSVRTGLSTETLTISLDDQPLP